MAGQAHSTAVPRLSELRPANDLDRPPGLLVAPDRGDAEVLRVRQTANGEEHATAVPLCHAIVCRLQVGVPTEEVRHGSPRWTPTGRGASDGAPGYLVLPGEGAAVDRDDRSGHEARGVRGEEQGEALHLGRVGHT